MAEYVVPLGQTTVGIGFLAGGPAALQVAAPLAGVNNQLGHLGLALLLVALAALTLSVLLGWFVSRTAVGPLNELTAAVEGIARTTDVSERLPPGGADELGRLRAAFNRLLSALERSRESQHQLVLDASHELRTPLTSLRTNLEILRRIDELSEPEREVLVSDVLTQLQELTNLVGDLSELARGGQAHLETAPLRLDSLVEDAVELANSHGRSRGVRFVTSLEPTWIEGRSDRITRAVGNLLDNALKWSPDGGSVEVTCVRGDVIVRDHGPGIDARGPPPHLRPLLSGPGRPGAPGVGSRPGHRGPGGRGGGGLDRCLQRLRWRRRPHAALPGGARSGRSAERPLRNAGTRPMPRGGERPGWRGEGQANPRP